MIWKTSLPSGRATRGHGGALSAALLMGAAVVAAQVLIAPAPVYAGAAPKGAPAIRIENKELADAFTAAQQDARAGRFAEALVKARAVDAMAGKPPALTRGLHQLMVSWAVSARNYPAALEQIEKNIAANEGDRNANMRTALSIAIVMKNTQKANQYAEALGANLDTETRLFIASQMADAGQLREALNYAQPALTVPAPTEAALRFKQNIAFRMNDPALRRSALEQLAFTYPKLEYWHDLLQLARNDRGLTDEQRLDIFRLRMAVGDLKTGDDYQEMAQQALVAGYPAEAKAVLDKATAAKLLSGERAGRLIKMTNDNVAADAAVQAELDKKRAADPNAALKLGQIYRTFGKTAESEAAIRAAMASGKLADPDAATLALGHTLFAQGKKPEATAAYNSVARNARSKHAPIARLWAIYARRA